MKNLKTYYICVWVLALLASPPLAAQECGAAVKVHEVEMGRILRAVDTHLGIAIAVGDDGLVLYSDDGTNWTDLNSGTTDDFIDVVWAGDRFALMANRVGRTTIWTWDDVNGLLELTDLIPGTSGKTGHAIGWAPPNLIITFTDNLFVTRLVRSTQDFVTLSNSDLNLTSNCGEPRSILTENGVTVMGVQCLNNQLLDRTAVYYSQDGINFPVRVFPPFEALGPGGLGTNGTISFASASTWDVGVGGFVSGFYHTPDLMNAPFVFHPDDGSLRTQSQATAWIHPYFVSVGPIGNIILSTDGLNWSNIPSPNKGLLRDITEYDDGYFIAVGDLETIIWGQTESYFSILENWPERADCRDIITRIRNCIDP